MDPLTLTWTESRFRKLLESMLCDTIKHRPNCACQDLKSIYGGSIYKCSRPGCESYMVGFDTRPKRLQHMQRHTRPFKCQYSGCAFVTIGFAEETDLKSHLYKTHGQNLHTVSGATLECMNSSSDEELKTILIDAVKENDLSLIRSEKIAAQKFILNLLLSAYQGRSSDAMIKHLLGEIPTRNIQIRGEYPDVGIYRDIIQALVENGHYDVIPRVCDIVDHSSGLWNVPLLFFIGRTRRADLIKIVLPSLGNLSPSSLAHDTWLNWRYLFEGILPRKPDPQAEILALECLNSLQSDLSTFSKLPKILLIELAANCCSIAIAEFLLANGATVDFSNGGLRPLTAAAKQNSQEAAEFMRFLVRKGARIPSKARGKAFSELPGPRNVQKWIGVTWEELVKQNDPSA